MSAVRVIVRLFFLKNSAVILLKSFILLFTYLSYYLAVFLNFFVIGA